MYRIVLIALALLALSIGMSRAEPRIALIIGNGSYQHVGALDNPVPDADLMAASLQQVGFAVTVLTNSDQAAMKRGISDFGRALRQAGPDTTALFYYAGHAVQSFGNNYLLPVDSAIRHQADLDLYGVEADWILRQLFAARVRTSIVILDACRDNPFESLQGFDGEGLAEMDAPTGSFIAYATAPGKVAFDGTGSNSPYTQALAQAITTDPQPIEQVFKSVRISVLQETNGLQTPWDSSSLTSNFRFRQTPEEGGISAAEQNFWNSVKDSKEPNQLELFLKVYPNSIFGSEARNLIVAMQEKRAISIVDPNEVPATNGPITFVSPLVEGAPHVVGKSIEQIFTQGSPIFPPIEGLPDELWKDQNCKNCHQWTRELLCEQGSFYLTENATRALDKQHPLGGSFKSNLRAWAEAGCL